MNHNLIITTIYETFKYHNVESFEEQLNFIRVVCAFTYLNKRTRRVTLIPIKDILKIQEEIEIEE